MNSILSTTTNLLWLMFHIVKAKTQMTIEEPRILQISRETKRFSIIKKLAPKFASLVGGC